MDQPSQLYRFLRGIVRTIVKLFYRDVTVEGTEHVPLDRGGLLVAWHPNGLIDPALILSSFPGQVVFGARDGLLRWPIVGPMMRGLGTVPIYRAVDQEGMSVEERRAANAKSLGALATEIATGSYSALFPEGVSHDNPHLSEVRSGAARLYLQALDATTEGPPPAIVPVGLHYQDKDVFRTDVLIEYHAPLDLDAFDLEAEDTRIDELTEAIEAALTDTVHPTDDWALHALMHRARTLLTAEAAARRGERPELETVASRAEGFGQIWDGYQVRRETHPDEIAALRSDLEAYDAGLRTMGMDDADLDRPPLVGSPGRVAAAVLQAALIAALLPPLFVLGAVVNVPPYWLLKLVAKKVAKTEKDTATVKLFGGLTFFPIAWITAGVLAAHGVNVMAGVEMPRAPWAVGILVTVLSAFGGAAVLLFTEVFQATWKAVRVRVARWRQGGRISGLQYQRAALHDRFMALARGLGLEDE
ncbi:1-acyl-sn-glycerol-3-phosphate acyltransferase [Rubrivirga sp.]|uniref:1-acyl-sn-glycerol-3-phosphate acyltransferase n=1 Tax=Rubrivirga sp. TaxID=1885344 RepID=UPI003C738232